MPPDVPVVREWLTKAHNDLRTAKLAIDADPPLLDTGCFHCQQTVEKSLKGYLCWRDVAFPKVHALGLIFDLCQQEDDSFANIRDACEGLTRFAVQDRYPHGRPISLAKARAALAAAESAFAFVLQRLPSEVHP
jgi:HEPN domain-containing protein